jgi:hypothetical protein
MCSMSDEMQGKDYLWIYVVFFNIKTAEEWILQRTYFETLCIPAADLQLLHLFSGG